VQRINCTEVFSNLNITIHTVEQDTYGRVRSLRSQLPSMMPFVERRVLPYDASDSHPPYTPEPSSALIFTPTVPLIKSSIRLIGERISTCLACSSKGSPANSPSPQTSCHDCLQSRSLLLHSTHHALLLSKTSIRRHDTYAGCTNRRAAYRHSDEEWTIQASSVQSHEARHEAPQQEAPEISPEASTSIRQIPSCQGPSGRIIGR